MFNKAIFISIALSILVGTATWFLGFSNNFQLNTNTFPYIVAAVFLISFISSMAMARVTGGFSGNNSEKKGEASSAYSDSPREAGNVKWFNASKGFGFITRDSGDDIFVHFRSIRGEGHRVLYDGQRVEFAISEGDKGLQAEDVAASK